MHEPSPQVDLRLGADATVDAVAGLAARAVVVATGARPFAPDLPLAGDVRQAWDVLGDTVPAGQRIVVADWGGDPAGLDTADLLAAAGNHVTLVVASVTVGESVHQYRRNLYLQRLYRAGVTILQHLELVTASGGEARFRNVFAPELEISLPADILVLALGRVPEDTLAAVPPCSGSTGRGGRRLPLAALARGGSARGDARGAPRDSARNDLVSPRAGWNPAPTKTAGSSTVVSFRGQAVFVRGGRTATVPAPQTNDAILDAYLS